MIDAMTAGIQQPAMSAPPSNAGDTDDANTFEAMNESESEGGSKAKQSLSVGQAAVHAALDGAQMVPEVGHLAALANGALYLQQGHDAQAGLSFGEALLPGADQLGGAMAAVRIAGHLGSAGFGLGHAEANKQQGIGS